MPMTHITSVRDKYGALKGWWLTWESRGTGRKTRSSATTNPTWIDTCSNPDLWTMAWL